jgi:5-methyltetrahydrofolate--homocysteine methyltransferase
MAIQDICRAVQEFELDAIVGLVKAELDQGTPVETILAEGLIAAMDEVGRRFAEGDLFVPEMLQSARTMKAGLEVLRPLLAETDAKPRGTIVMGTVKGDLHDIGKNLVSMMLEGAGFKVIDLGVDVGTDKFLAAASANQAEIVAMSALLTTTMPAMEATVATIKERGLGLKTMIGGAPVTLAFADKIGADGYSEDAPGAVALARRLVAA